jgi:hypothetical protein
MWWRSSWVVFSGAMKVKWYKYLQRHCIWGLVFVESWICAWNAILDWGTFQMLYVWGTGPIWHYRVFSVDCWQNITIESILIPPCNTIEKSKGYEHFCKALYVMLNRQSARVGVNSKSVNSGSKLKFQFINWKRASTFYSQWLLNNPNRNFIFIFWLTSIGIAYNPGVGSIQEMPIRGMVTGETARCRNSCC